MDDTFFPPQDDFQFPGDGNFLVQDENMPPNNQNQLLSPRTPLGQKAGNQQDTPFVLDVIRSSNKDSVASFEKDVEEEQESVGARRALKDALEARAEGEKVSFTELTKKVRLLCSGFIWRC